MISFATVYISKKTVSGQSRKGYLQEIRPDKYARVKANSDSLNTLLTLCYVY
jgi:hypothetical protein